MKKRVLYVMIVLAALLCMTLRMVTPVMAGQISGSKHTIPNSPNIYCIGDTIYYETTVTNPVGNTANNTLTRIWDTLPDGTVIELLGADETLIQMPGETDIFYTEYVVDWDDAEYNEILGYWIVTDTFRAEGYDSAGDDLYVRVTKNSRIIQPHINIKKYVWDGAAWQDADTPTGPHLLSTQNPVIFKFDIDNTGDVELTGVNLTDTDMSVFYTDLNCTSQAVFPIPILYDDDPIVTVYGKLAFTPGQHSNNATVTGTPPVGAPVSDSDPANYLGGNPAIDLVKYVSVNNQTSWDDANLAPGPSILVGKDVYFKFYIKNTGNVTLTGITLTDTMYNLAGISPALPASLAAGAEYNGIIGPIVATVGGHTNTGNATGYWEGTPVSDTDPANYFGLTPGVDIEKYVSVDNGVTWLDADLAPGPSALVGKNVSFYVSVCNTGAANLTSILVGDTDFGFIGVVTSLAVGACDNSSIVTVPAVAGQQWDVANVTAQANGSSLFDEDPAYYTGLTSGIDIEKYVSVDNGVTWLDADLAPGPSALVGKNVSFYVSVCNAGTANLTSVLVSDTDFGFTGVVTSLVVGACDNSSIVTVPAVAGQQWDVANVTAQADGVSVFDEDPAYYKGVSGGIDIEKYVSVDNGVIWLDADSAPGPSALVGKNVSFYVSVCNTGTANLTNILVADTDFVFTGVVTSLVVGACDNSSIVIVPAVAGQQWDVANVTAQANGFSVFDEDPAYYIGLTSGIDIEKYVSVDDGVTWLDADSAPGASALAGKNVSFYVSVCNTGTANLTSILVSDTDFMFTGVVTSLVVGACDNSSIVTVPAVAGQQWDVANVTAQADGVSVFDEDPAYYRIGAPPVGWETYPVDKVHVLLPWIGLLGAIIAGASLLVLKRRRLSQRS